MRLPETIAVSKITPYSLIDFSLYSVMYTQQSTQECAVNAYRAITNNCLSRKDNFFSKRGCNALWDC